MRARSTASAGGSRPDPTVAPPEPFSHRPPARPPGRDQARARRDRHRHHPRRDRGLDRDIARIPHRRREHVPARVERLRGDDGVRQRRGPADAARRHPRRGTRWEPLLDERFAVSGAYMIPHGAFDWERRRRPPLHPRLGAEREPRRLASRRRAVRADAPHRRPPARASSRSASPAPACAPPPTTLAGLVAVADHAALALAERPGGGGRGPPPGGAAPAPAGVVAPDRDAVGERDPAVRRARASPTRSGSTRSASTCPTRVTGRLHDARGDRVDARGHAPEHADRRCGSWRRCSIRRSSVQGCYLLTLEEAMARLPDGLTACAARR